MTNELCGLMIRSTIQHSSNYNPPKIIYDAALKNVNIIVLSMPLCV